MWPFSKKPEPVAKAHPDPVNTAAPPRKRPLAVSVAFDVDTVSDFGTQVFNLLMLQPDAFVVHPNLSEFSHELLGKFEILSDGRIDHYPTVSLGSKLPEGHQRALTAGDSVNIISALQTILQRPMDITTNNAPKAGRNVFTGEKPTVAAVGDLFISDDNGPLIWDGATWVPVKTSKQWASETMNSTFGKSLLNQQDMLNAMQKSQLEQMQQRFAGQLGLPPS